MAEAFGGFAFVVTIFLIVLVILWFFLPFAVFGTKAKLDSLIHEMKLANIELTKVREQLAKNSDEGSRPLTEEPAKAILTHDQAMEKYGLSHDGDKYVIRGERFDKIQDAVAYARKTADT